MIVDTWRVFTVTVLVFCVYFEIQNTMRWSEGDTVKFVELYREHECLWNIMKPSYRNNQMREGALENIVKEMGIEGFTVADARQKVKLYEILITSNSRKLKNHENLEWAVKTFTLRH